MEGDISILCIPHDTSTFCICGKSLSGCMEFIRRSRTRNGWQTRSFAGDRVDLAEWQAIHGCFHGCDRQPRQHPDKAFSGIDVLLVRPTPQAISTASSQCCRSVWRMDRMPSADPAFPCCGVASTCCANWKMRRSSRRFIQGTSESFRLPASPDMPPCSNHV